MPNSVAANGTPLSTLANGSRDARYASNIGEPENIVPASNVVRHVSKKRTTFQIGRRSRRRAGAGGRAYSWPFVVANGSAANGRSAMPLSVSRAQGRGREWPSSTTLPDDTPGRGPLATTRRARVARRRGEPHQARLRDTARPA